MQRLKTILLLVLCLTASMSKAQVNPDTVKAGIYDNGKMWTFDYPPTDYFKKTYQF
jgi:hypothetical protein